MKSVVLLVLFVFVSYSMNAENGHQLWLRHSNPQAVNVVCPNGTPVLSLAQKELVTGGD